MDIHKRIARSLIWRVCGENLQGIAAIPILKGPLKGKMLPKEPALDQLSMLFGRYEPAVISAILQLPNTVRIAYDVGAHVGYIALALAHLEKYDGKIFAFEPVSDNMELIRKLTALNKLERLVEVFPLGLGDKIGEQRFIVWGSSSMHLLDAAVNGQDTSSCPSVVVETCTLDSFVFDLNNPPPHLIKIDVEGAEALVLKGGLRTLAAYAPNIIIEIHGPTNARSVWEVLNNLDYRWLKLTKKGRSEVHTEENLVSFFTKRSWTHHFLLIKEQRDRSIEEQEGGSRRGRN